MSTPYNADSKESIIEFAKLLIGKSVSLEFKDEIPKLGLSSNDKGQLGKVIEELYFKYKPNSSSEADFKSAGLELKSSGLKQLKNKHFRAKERLVLNIINFFDALNKNFEDDFLIGKNAHLLLIFYLYQKNTDQLASIIKLVGDWKYPEADLEIIKKDWELIKKKITDGKAHELSEGDTFYLGACTKGSKGGSLRKQPNSSEWAKQRAYSLKQGYLNHVIASIANEPASVYGKLISTAAIGKKHTIEDVVLDKFSNLMGLTDAQLVTKFSLNSINPKIKNYHSKIANEIVKSIFNVPKNKKIEEYIEEFDKADVVVKTVRLKENNLPKEDISFPTFSYEELIEEGWEESEIKNKLERKFLFVFFQYEKNQLIFRRVRFWNMPCSDVEKVREVWLKTKDVVSAGDVVKELKTNKNGKVVRKTNFPNKKFNSISHVRPHATNAKDTNPLPIRDKITSQSTYTKHCFWLNNNYIRDEIYLK